MDELSRYRDRQAQAGELILVTLRRIPILCKPFVPLSRPSQPLKRKSVNQAHDAGRASKKARTDALEELEDSFDVLDKAVTKKSVKQSAQISKPSSSRFTALPAAKPTASASVRPTAAPVDSNELFFSVCCLLQVDFMLI